jgi:hypothetical protein
MVSFLHVKDYQIVSEHGPMTPTGRLDRDHLSLSDVLAESFDVDAPALLRPVFDTLWQTCGRERSLSYDEHGNFLAKRG